MEPSVLSPLDRHNGSPRITLLNTVMKFQVTQRRNFQSSIANINIQQKFVCHGFSLVCTSQPFHLRIAKDFVPLNVVFHLEYQVIYIEQKPGNPNLGTFRIIQSLGFVHQPMFEVKNSTQCVRNKTSPYSQVEV